MIAGEASWAGADELIEPGGGALLIEPWRWTPLAFGTQLTSNLTSVGSGPGAAAAEAPGSWRGTLRMYRIRKVDGFDAEIAETLGELHRMTFYDSAPIPGFDVGDWWLAFRARQPVGFAGVVPSTHAENAGYFSRVGVLREHRGSALQLRLMRAIEVHARREGWCCMVSDTTDNLASANNFIRAGYLLYQPRRPWAWAHTLYWRKSLKGPAASRPVVR